MKYFDRQRTRLEKKIIFYKSQINLNMKWRLFTGISLIFLIIVIASWPQGKILGILFIIGSMAMIFLVQQTSKLRKKLSLYTNWADFLDRQKLKQEGTYEKENFFSDDTICKDASLNKDLHLTGKKSIFNLLDECISNGGRDKLLIWLMNPLNELSTITSRQDKIKGLSKYYWPLLKMKLLSKSEDLDTLNLLNEFKEPVVSSQFRIKAWGHALLFPLSWGLAISSWFQLIDLRAVVPLGLYFIYSIWSQSDIHFSFQRAHSLALQIKGLIPLFKYIEENPHLPFGENIPTIKEIEFSKKLQRLDRITSALSVQGHPMVHFLVNGFAPWNYIFTGLLEKWRHSFNRQLPKLMGEWHEFEALMSLAFFYKYQTKTFPSLAPAHKASSDSCPTIHFENLIHPLIDRKSSVGNTFSLPIGQRLVLITGSNMSGKSTFLRTLGVNQILALMGAPVYASSLHTFLGPVFTCLQTADSLEQGYSTFYYEVKQISKIIKAAEAQQGFLYLIDEIFRGTNNKERLIGSQAIIAQLIPFPHVVGFITTHDLELAAMEKDFSQLGNWHFKDDIKSNQLTFSYKICKGPCPTTNALKIMKAEGLPVSIQPEKP